MKIVDYLELAPWPREAAEVWRLQLHHVHVEPRRVGKLHQHDLVAWDRADRLQIGLARKNMEAVERQPDRRMIGAPHHLPAIAIIGYVRGPWASASKPTRMPPFARARQARGSRPRRGRRRRAIRADTLEQIISRSQPSSPIRSNLALLGAREVPRALRLRHAFEVAKRLERRDLAGRGDAARLGDVLRSSIERQEVVLEDLDAGKSRGRNGFASFSPGPPA